MSTSQTGPTHGQLTSMGMKAVTDHQHNVAEHRSIELQKAARAANGRIMAKLTPDDWDWVLDEVACGHSDRDIAAQLGIHPSSINLKRRRDPDFGERYNDAVADALYTIARDIPRVTRGEPGFSTGDPRRDELVVKYDLELAKRLNRKLFGDRVQVDHATVTVNLPDWTGDV